MISSSGGRPRLLRSVSGKHAFITDLIWSPRSQRLVSVETRDLVVVDATTGAARRFARGGSLVGMNTPSFSPGGRKIVYQRYDQTGSDLYVFDLPTGLTRRITFDHRSGQPLWGPRWIAFNRGGPVRGGDVWVVDGAGRRLRRLTRTRAGIYPAAWSEDGTRLLAASPATHNGRLWSVAVPSGRARDLTGWVGDLFPQGLSRDGTTILAAIGCGGLISPFGVVETLPFAGGKPRAIVKGPCRASWNR